MSVKKLDIVFCMFTAVVSAVSPVKSGSKLNEVVISTKVSIGSLNSVSIDIMARLSLRLVFIAFLVFVCTAAVTLSLNFKLT